MTHIMNERNMDLETDVEEWNEGEEEKQHEWFISPLNS